MNKRIKKYVFLIIGLLAMCCSAEASVNDAEVSVDNAVTYEYWDDGSGFELTGTASKNGPFYTSDKMYVSLYTQNDNLIYMDSVSKLKDKQNIEISYNADGINYGDFDVVVTITNYKGEVETYNYPCLIQKPSDVTDATLDFENIDNTSKVENFINTYINGDKKIINTRLYNAIDFSIPTDDPGTSQINEKDIYLQRFLSVCRYMSENSVMNRAGIDTIQPKVLNIYMLLSVWDALDDGNVSEAQSAITNNSDLVNETLTEVYDLEKTISIYSNYYDSQNDFSKFRKYFITSVALERFDGGTAENISNAWDKYSNVLFDNSEITLGYAISNNVSLSEVGTYMRGENIMSYMNNLPQYFKNTVDKIVLNKKGQSGSGGGYVSNNSSSVPGLSVPVGGDANVPVQNGNNDNNSVLEESYKFNDLGNFSWAEPYIMRLVEKNVISKSDNNMFNPDRNITREEFLKMLVIAIDIRANSDKEMLFQDCVEDGWYYPYVKLAYMSGIVNGIDKYTFGIGNNITRQDMSVMIYNAMETKNVVIAKPNNNFTSSENFADYAREKFSSIVETGILNGYDDGTFRPTSMSTRAEAATVICRLIDYLEGGI